MINNDLLPKENIELQVEKSNHIAIDALEEWQFDSLSIDLNKEATVSLGQLDNIPSKWFNELTPKDRLKIFNQQSLQGITIPKEWIIMWRMIIKTPNLRDPERATRNGSKVGTDQHIWNLWSQDTLYSHIDDMEAELIRLNDWGEPHMNIGCQMIEQYGDRFYKPRKAKSTTTPAKVVNYYFSTKLPTKVARSTLCEFALHILNKANKMNKAKRASK